MSEEKKRPRSGYLIFSIENRQKIIAENPGIEKKQKEIMKLIAGKWKSLTDEEKKPYQERAAAEKKEFAKTQVGKPKKSKK
ncbi:Non-histone chromosomal protein 6 [Histomonas meleagridis]|uniref:Non-histone chromosomal protein 6 n=1 Tax=Histomonas meleagridis TaxID=135588 RepID=UPI00355AB854|nr:Non-histone chromosomal protein 6 [Histomonas meleagridis]KAH0796576.1 Non-histone chromosomal protein 6 [Histomonas meleagridis]